MMNKYSQYKIVWHKDKLDSFATGEIKAPIYVRIKPTNKCSHDCRWCIYKPEFSGMHETANRTDEIPRFKLLEILCDLKEIGVKAITWSGGGSPLVYPHIEEMFLLANNLELDNSIITNGQLLNEGRAKLLTNAKWVRVSMDYYDQKSFQQSRGIDGKNYNVVLNNGYEFAKIKQKDCDLGVNFIVTQENYTNLFVVAKKVKEHGFENIRFAPVWQPAFKSYHTPLKEEVLLQLQHAREALNDDNFKVYDSYDINWLERTRQTDRCYVMQTIPVIGADQFIYNCHNKAYMDDGCIGSIRDKKFSDLWFSKEAKEYFNNFNPKKTCAYYQCSNDKKNIIIQELLDAKGCNFI